MDANTVTRQKLAVASSLYGTGVRSLSSADNGPVPLSLDEAEKVSGGVGGTPSPVQEGRDFFTGAYFLR